MLMTLSVVFLRGKACNISCASIISIRFKTLVENIMSCVIPDFSLLINLWSLLHRLLVTKQVHACATGIWYIIKNREMRHKNRMLWNGTRHWR